MRRKPAGRKSVRNFNRNEKYRHPFNYAVTRGGWRL